MSEFTTHASCAARQNKPIGLPPGSTTDSLFCLRVFQSFLCMCSFLRQDILHIIWHHLLSY